MYIENLMRSRKLRRSEGKVQRAYAAYLMGDRELFENILMER